MNRVIRTLVLRGQKTSITNGAAIQLALALIDKELRRLMARKRTDQGASSETFWNLEPSADGDSSRPDRWFSAPHCPGTNKQ